MRRTTAWIGAVTLILTIVAGVTPAEAAAPVVTLKATATPVGSDGESETGQVGVSGTATGVDPDETVYIEYRRDDGRWGRVGTATTEARGAFASRFPSPRAGSTRLRARVVVDGRSRTSKTVTVTLSKLFALTADDAATSRSLVDFVTQDGFNDPSVWLRYRSGKSAFGTWQLDGRCSDFFAAAGVVKTTTPGTGPVSVSVTTWVKGVAQVRLVNLTRSARTDLSDDVRSVTSIRIATSFSKADDTEPREIVAPQVLCTAAPSLDGL